MEETKEIWKPITGFEGYYEVSNMQNNKGCAHFEEICHGVKKLKDGRTLKELSLFDEV